MRDRKLIPRLQKWAREFDSIDRRRRYTAAEFVTWLEMEVAPPRKPLDPGPVYSALPTVAHLLV